MAHQDAQVYPIRPFLRFGDRPNFGYRAADLLACPPHLLHKHCLSCSYHTSPTLQPLGDDARHFVRCPKGLRLHSTVSDRVRDDNIRVIAERPGSHRQMSSFMLREGSSLLKQQYIIIPDLDGPRSFTLIDVKGCRSGCDRGPFEKTFF